MKVKLFNKEIELRDKYCSLNKYPATDIKTPYINLYVQFNGCNANCKFCEYKNSAKPFNLEKFEKVLKELSEQIKIRKISLTGGEATINKDFYKVTDIVSQYDSFLVVNTNGTNLKEIKEKGYIDKFNSIALSRHHYNDELNNEILGVESVSTQELIDMNLKNIHFSCNLQKDYINSDIEVYKYLDHISSMGYDDVGFVSLMKINDYATEQFVDFETIKINDKYHLIKEWNYKNECKCNNYLYLTDDANVVKVYSRCVLKPTTNVSNLVFDGENLKTGFCGEILI
jgi:organic radical activating enzyme